MRNLFLMFNLFVFGSLLACSGGGSDEEIVTEKHFSTLNGRWKIDAQNVNVEQCGVIISGGLTAGFDLSVNGNNVLATIEGFSDSLSGVVTADGFILSQDNEASNERAGVKYVITISGISPTGPNEFGESSYSYISKFADGTTACEFTATGTAQHISE